MRIALAGNPNSGKTTIYNAITGKTESVGNWPGVTVSVKEANLKRKYNTYNTEMRIVDLPGTYSISPYTGEEAITKEYILEENTDVIINIVDGANLSRSLFFTTQLIELGIPMVIALNKIDILNKRGDQLDLDILSKELGCKVIETTATVEEGLPNLLAESVSVVDNSKQKEPSLVFDKTDLQRQREVDSIIDKCLTRKRDPRKLYVSDKADRILAHRWMGVPIFFLIMWAVFSTAINGPGGFLSDYFNEVLFAETIPELATSFFTSIGVGQFLQDLIINGAIAGVGAVIGFLPLVMILFFFLALLEDCGYMSRVALLMDKYFKKIGLSGKSIIPMIVGSGCAIPGVMATRTVDDENERRMTTILTPFVPCGAKLPIIALFSAVFFPNHIWVGPSMYVIAIVMIVVGGLLLKKIYGWDNSSIFIIELPEYKLPSFKYAFSQMLDKAKGFIYKATTIILVCNTIVWFAQAYTWNLQPAVDQSTSILASLATLIAPLLIPLGFVGWQLAAASVTGFIAKENVVATFAVLLAASESVLHTPGGLLTEFFTPVTAFAYLVFNLFTPPCFAAIGAMNSELGSKKWLFRALAFQFGVGYTLAMLISQMGSIFIYGKLAVGFVPSVFITIGVVVLLYVLIKRNETRHTSIGVEA